MLARRRRRWANIELTPGQRIVIAGIVTINGTANDFLRMKETRIKLISKLTIFKASLIPRICLLFSDLMLTNVSGCLSIQLTNMSFGGERVHSYKYGKCVFIWRASKLGFHKNQALIIYVWSYTYPFFFFFRYYKTSEYKCFRVYLQLPPMNLSCSAWLRRHQRSLCFHI